MSRIGVGLIVLTLALLGVGIFSIDFAGPSIGGKKHKPETTKTSSSKSGSIGRKSTSSGQGSAEGRERSEKSRKSGREASEQAEEEPRYHLPYEANTGYPVARSDEGSNAIGFDLPRGTAVSAIRTGKIIGVSGAAPRPGEDLIFGRRLPRNAILIDHADSTFALYQNVDSAVDTGTVVTDRTLIGKARSEGVVKVSVTRLDEERLEWHFSTRSEPDGGYLRSGEVYLRADSKVDHPANAVERTYTADAGNYAKSEFRSGESVRLHGRFAFPARADVTFKVRPAGSRRSIDCDARLDTERRSAHCDLRPDELPGDDNYTAVLFFDDQPMDTVRFTVGTR